MPITKVPVSAWALHWQCQFRVSSVNGGVTFPRLAEARLSSVVFWSILKLFLAIESFSHFDCVRAS